MNKYRKFAVIFITFEILIIIFMNVYNVRVLKESQEKYYQVDISRILEHIRDGEKPADIDLTAYKSIHSVSVFDSDIRGQYDYKVEAVDGTLYRFEYYKNKDDQLLRLVNIVLGVLLLATIFMFAYLDKKLITPFSRISQLPKELAKGNLTVPIKEEKNKYFGKFLWGMDNLREKLEDDKKRELNLIKEKKTLILSLSHDIKTPLSAIELYTRALKQDFYDSESKKQEVYEAIEKNVGQIKKYVSEISDASKEDFLTLSVNNGEVYLSECMDAIKGYYTEKFKRLHTEFLIGPFDNCILYGDKDRIIEVMQNALENAVKYGDGSRVEISFDEEENCKLITIKNTGCEIEKEELVHLFDSFYRGSNSEGVDGSGLGLYIGKKLMKMMDGELFAKINGNIFEITLVVRKM